MANPQTTYVIDLPFDLSTKKKVMTIPDNDPKVWKNKVLSLLSIGTNERVWYHSYGANLSDLLFEPSAVAVEDARIALAEVFASWLPELTLQDINAGYDQTNGSITLEIMYKIPSGEVNSVKISNASLTVAGDTIEVNNG
jgi:phage baseplate assembly protein W